MTSVKKNLQKPAVVKLVEWKIPLQLRTQGRWLCWSWHEKRDADGNFVKWDKPPCSPKSSKGGWGSSTDSSSWTSFDEAKAAMIQKGHDGLGFAMGKDGCGLIGIDIDNCRNPVTGEVSDFAKRIIDSLDTYTEISPSGEGIKLWLSGELPVGDYKTADHELGLEIYIKGRYFTVTSHSYHEEPKIIASRPRALKVLMATYMANEASAPNEEVDVQFALSASQTALAELEDGEFVDDYDVYINTGFAIKWIADTDAAFEVWDAWCTLGSKYPGKVENRKKWNSFPPPRKGKVTPGSLHRLAKLANPDYIVPRRRLSFDDYGMAQRVAERVRNRLRFQAGTRGRYLAWDGSKWREDGPRGLIQSEIVQTAKLTSSAEWPHDADEKIQQRFSNWIAQYGNARGIGSVESLVRGLIATAQAEFDVNPMMFHCKNGVYDLENNRFLDSDPKYLNTVVAGVAYDSSATCPTFLAFMDDLTGGQADKRDYLQELMGYSLSGETYDQSIYIMRGLGGTGKSTFATTMQKLHGEYGTSPDPSLLTGASSTNDARYMASLIGKRFAYISELDRNGRLNVNRVKRLSGGDTVMAQKLYVDIIEFIPTTKVFVTTNNLPIVPDNDYATWRRLKIIDLDSVVKKKDPKLDRKLEAELPGILNWALEGWRRVQNRGQVLHPKSVIDVVNAHRDSSDLFGEYFDTHFVNEPGSKVRLKQAFGSWLLYCRHLNVPSYQVTLADFREEVIRKGYEVRKSTGNASFIFGIDYVEMMRPAEDELQFS